MVIHTNQKSMKRIAVIPARKGSKRFKNKNISLFNGVSLIENTFNQIDGFFDEVWLNTNSNKYLKIVDHLDIKPYLRPEKLGQNQTSINEVLVEWINSNSIHELDLVYLFQPTSPFRSKELIESFIKDSNNLGKNESLITTSVLKKISRLNENNYLVPLDYDFGSSEKNDKKIFFKENGLCYCSKVETILKHGIFGTKTKSFYSDEYNLPIDIDFEYELKFANLLMNHGI